MKADATEFAVNLVLPANLPAGEYKGLKLSANAPAPGQPALRIRSQRCRNCRCHGTEAHVLMVLLLVNRDPTG